MMRDLWLKLLLGFRGNTVPGRAKKRVGAWMLRNVPGMLTCAEFEEFVHDYHEDLLPEPARRRFDRHMLVCPMCQVHFDSYVRAVALGQAVCEDELPDDIPEELVGAIRLAMEARMDGG